MALTLEFRHSEQQLRTHILEAKWFMQDRGLETLSVNAFPSLKEDSFPRILHAENHTLLVGHFSVASPLML